VGVVEQGVVAVSPEERLVADAEVRVGHKLIPVVVGFMLHLPPVGIHHAEQDAGHRHEERQHLPGLGGAVGIRRGGRRFVAARGPAQGRC